MGKIITFYSYKGGTGRSMALAKISILLAQWYEQITKEISACNCISRFWF